MLSKQCFVINFCRAGGCLCEAIKYIGKARKKKNGEELKDVVDVNILDEFDKVLTILDCFFFLYFRNNKIIIDNNGIVFSDRCQ